jgi:threonine dehydrogenase-like Zn-dependent dehydrogenase
VDRGSPVNARVELAPQVEISVHFLPAVCHVDCYLRPLLERIANSDIDPTPVITHRMTRSDAAKGYDIFLNQEDNYEKVVLHA